MSKTKEETMSLQDMQCLKTVLYDCTLDMRIEAPNNKDLNIDLIQRTTLTTIALEIITKHEEYKSMMGSIYGILRKTWSQSSRKFQVFKETRLVVKKKVHNAGHILQLGPRKRKIIDDTIKFSGEVHEDFDNSGPVNVDYTVQIFLSPGVYAAKDFYEEHKFPTYHFQGKDMENINEIMEKWCPEMECQTDEFNFGERWTWLAAGIDKYEKYWETKRLEDAAFAKQKQELDAETTRGKLRRRK